MQRFKLQACERENICNRGYTKRLFFFSKMVYYRVRGWASGEPPRIKLCWEPCSPQGEFSWFFNYLKDRPTLTKDFSHSLWGGKQQDTLQNLYKGATNRINTGRDWTHGKITKCTENICALLTEQKVKIAGYCFSIIYRLRQSRGRQKYEKKKKKRKYHRSYNVRNFSRKR